jgi:hypothetical protein
MTQRDGATRDEIMAKLAESRAEIQRLLDPPPREEREAGPARDAPAGEFPRSRTMRALLSGRGLSAVGAVVGGLVLARPALLWRLVRLLPTSAVARMLLLRAISAMRAKHE